jgi:UDPglucose 6-dehydrogenase
MRDAPSIKIVETLLAAGAEVIAHDPRALTYAKTVFGNRVQYEDRVTNCLEGTDCCIVVTDWDEYMGLRADDFRKLMRKPNVVDGRGFMTLTNSRKST